MQGGIDNWKKCGGTVSNKENNIKLGNYTANKERKELVINLGQMIKASKDKNNVILDARSKKRFFGEAKEPRPNLPSGHNFIYKYYDPVIEKSNLNLIYWAFINPCFINSFD